MDKQAVMDVLDRAVSETITDELGRLTGKTSDEARRCLMDHARGEVFKLAQAKMPDYNGELVPAVYVAAYQLQHINMTYSLIKDLLVTMGPTKNVLSAGGKLQVVDFGAGALAMQFGLTLAIADALEQKQQITAVHVDSMDQSEEMLLIGITMWEKVVHIAKNDKTGRLRALDQACQLVGYQPHTSIDTIKARYHQG